MDWGRQGELLKMTSLPGSRTALNPDKRPPISRGTPSPATSWTRARDCSRESHELFVSLGSGSESNPAGSAQYQRDADAASPICR